METALRVFLVVIALIATFFAGASVGQRSGGIGDFADNLVSGSNDAELTSEALDVINESYFRDVDNDELEDASVAGIVKTLRKRYKDRFSHYFTPDQYSEFQTLATGRFSGVGLTVNEVKRGLRVATVFRDSPAREAGIEEGDIVTKVEGKPIAGKSADLATAQIKGEPGTEVTITVFRPTTKKTRDYKLERRELVVPAVESKLRMAGGKPVGYIRLLGFSGGAHAELRDAVDKLDARGAEGLVLDLRGNGGGLLDEAVLTSSVFVEDGVIVSTKGRTQSDKEFTAIGDAVKQRPTLVLINGDSASASEIFTAALNDSGVARVVGETSFGKGVFQEVIELDNGGALDITVGEYLTRDGVSLAGAGIEPELPAVDNPKTKPDEGLRKALNALGSALDSPQQ